MPLGADIETRRLRFSVDKRLLIAVFAGSLGGFVFGYDLGGLSAASENLRAHFNLSSWLFGLTISSSIWGTVVGSILTGRFADDRDRRDLVAACAVLYALAASAITLPAFGHWWFVIAMRFVSGMAIGGFTVACPLYLSEIAPVKNRGRIVALFQLQVGIGVVIAFCVGAVFAPLPTAWRPILGIGALPAFVSFLLARRMPRIPPMHSSRTQPRGRSSQAHFAVAANHQKLFRRQNARLILVATSIAVFNQLSGVNILLLYMLAILSSAGISFALGHRYTVLISVLGLVITLAGMAFIDRLGRKPLLYTGSAGMAVCLVMLALAIPHHLAPAFYGVLFVVYNAFFAFSQGTVVWVYLSELFPPGIRGLGQGYGASVHWIVNAVLVAVFPRLQRASTVKVFYLFALMMVVQIVVIRLYPETKGAALGGTSA